MDVSAPGGTGTTEACTGNANTLIYTTNHPVSPNPYALVCGTSFAAPHVAGVAALLAARGFYPCEIEQTIKENTDPINWQGGSGRLNAGKALSWWGGGPIVSGTNMPDGSLVQEEGDPKVYVIYRGTKFWIHSLADFDAMGFSWRNVQCVPTGFLSSVPDIPPDKTLIQEFGTAPIYVVHCDARFWVPDPPTLNMLLANGYADPPVYVVPPGEATRLSTVPLRDCHMKEVSTDPQYLICQGQKWHIPSPFVLGRMGLGSATLRVLWDGALAGFPLTTSVNFCTDWDNDKYSNALESYVGTWEILPCPLTPTANDEFPDAWPPDFDDNRTVDIVDVGALRAVFGTPANEQVDIIDGGIDANENGSVGPEDDLPADLTRSIVLHLASGGTDAVDVLNGLVDVNEDGAITAADDLADVYLALGPVVFEGGDIIDGRVDVDDNGSITAADDLANAQLGAFRFDLDASDYNINIVDLGALRPWFGTSCP